MNVEVAINIDVFMGYCHTGFFIKYWTEKLHTIVKTFAAVLVISHWYWIFFCQLEIKFISASILCFLEDCLARARAVKGNDLDFKSMYCWLCWVRLPKRLHFLPSFMNSPSHCSINISQIFCQRPILTIDKIIEVFCQFKIF